LNHISTIQHPEKAFTQAFVDIFRSCFCHFESKDLHTADRHFLNQHFCLEIKTIRYEKLFFKILMLFMSMWCVYHELTPTHEFIAEYFIPKTAVNQRQSQKRGLKLLVFLPGHKRPCNQSRQHAIVNEWFTEMVRVSGSGANLHIHSTLYTK